MILNAFFVDIDVFEIKNTIYKIISGHQFEINDFALNNIVLHVCIIIDRNKYEVQQARFSADSISTEADSPYACAAEIIKWIAEGYEFEVSSSDFDNIYALLLISMKKFVLRMTLLI